MAQAAQQQGGTPNPVDTLDKDEQAFFDQGGEVEDGGEDTQSGGEAQETQEGGGGDDTVQGGEGEDQGQRRRGGDLRAALHESRQETKAAREQFEKYRDETDRKIQLLARHAQQQNQGRQQTQDPEPDATEDPLGHLQWTNRQLTKQVQVLTQRAQHGDQQSVHAQAARRFTNMVTSDERRFSEAHADYDEAAEYLRSQWMDEFRASGVAETDVSQALVRRATELSISALRNRLSPAEVFYNLAKKRGFAPGNAGAGSGDRLRRQEQGQRFETPRGRGEEPALTIASIEKMSESELEERLSDPKFWTTVRRATE